MTNFSAGSVVRRVEQNNSYSFLKVFFCNPKDPQTMINYGSLLKIYTSDIRLYIKYNPAGFPTIFWTFCFLHFPSKWYWQGSHAAVHQREPTLCHSLHFMRIRSFSELRTGSLRILNPWKTQKITSLLVFSGIECIIYNEKK